MKIRIKECVGNSRIYGEDGSMAGTIEGWPKDGPAREICGTDGNVLYLSLIHILLILQNVCRQSRLYLRLRPGNRRSGGWQGWQGIYKGRGIRILQEFHVKCSGCFTGPHR